MLKFHWRLVLGGEDRAETRRTGASNPASSLPDLLAQTEFCRAAEEAGIDALLTDFGRQTADPIVLAAALGAAAHKVGFIVAYRSGLIGPVSFVQQINTLSAVLDGRVLLNVVAGHSPEEQRAYGDPLPHDERYARTEEFLAICRALWRGDGPVDHAGRYYQLERAFLGTPFVSPARRAPEIFIAGGSPAARDLAMKHGTCWMRFGDTPERVAREAAPFRERGIDVGVRLSIVLGSTHEEARQRAREMAEEGARRAAARASEESFVATTDSVSMRAAYAMAETEWLTPTLWTGAVRTFGTSALALVGAPDEIAAALLAYRDAGVTQFILSGWPKRQTMVDFGREVLPLVRRREAEEPVRSARPTEETRNR